MGLEHLLVSKTAFSLYIYVVGVRGNKSVCMCREYLERKEGGGAVLFLSMDGVCVVIGYGFSGWVVRAVVCVFALCNVISL